eukprot:CAMPEP_0201281054 /NCGR_PEP_ID=MMETSP1317-20130820/1136_1 /ASSEMBLY_ACC=CAM_ASM_000770 /TAXON_ID=187299 /ORGANISM="Undescribed Undescribed, Strain Undescribed" /LENGTH=175 /DNA_ID=CAMNT_0047589909 /DNA_START=1350 /DNA_END=1872 /DNA_ORIENTATION=+
MTSPFLALTAMALPKGVHDVVSVDSPEFPGPGCESIGCVVECPHGTQVHQVATEFTGEQPAHIGADLAVEAPAGHPQLGAAGHLLIEPDAPGALDAAGHHCLDQGPVLFVLNGVLVFVVPTYFVAIQPGDVLQVALPALVTNGAVQRVVCQQELHHACPTQGSHPGVSLHFHGGG